MQAGVLAVELKRRALCEEVEHVIDCIGSIDMTESLRRAVENNLLTLSNMIELAQRMRKLQSFVHISTAYVNAFRFAGSARAIKPHMLTCAVMDS
jgi:fatty acyl-CoA reductase